LAASSTIAHLLPSGVTTQYLIDDLSPTGYPQVVAEVVTGQPVRTYTYGLEWISELQTVNNAPTVSFYQYDGRGTVRMLTNSAGAVTDTYEYDAFGNLISKSGTTPNVYLYRGERYETDLGLYYLRARWYNPATGRFMTRDPYQGSVYDPASLHRYNYARANPANFIDPSGRLSAGVSKRSGLSCEWRGGPMIHRDEADKIARDYVRRQSLPQCPFALVERRNNGAAFRLGVFL
jgi:RHS repeat-associated protein